MNNYTQAMIESGKVNYSNGLWTRCCPQCQRVITYSGGSAKGNACFQAYKEKPCRSCSYDKGYKTTSISSPIAPEKTFNVDVIQINGPRSKETTVIQNVTCKEFTVTCLKCGTETKRKLYDDWIYGFSCGKCDYSIKFQFLFTNNIEEKKCKEEAKQLLNKINI